MTRQVCPSFLDGYFITILLLQLLLNTILYKNMPDARPPRAQMRARVPTTPDESTPETETSAPFFFAIAHTLQKKSCG